MKLNEDWSIDLCNAAEKPVCLPEGNRLPISRETKDLDIIMRLYAPDLEKSKAWEPPKAKRL